MPMQLPRPTRILWADICRDGGSYELAFTDENQRAWHLRLPVKLKDRGLWPSRERRLGYFPPVLRGQHPELADRVLDWDTAEALGAALAELTGAHIEMGGAERANAMIDHLRKRGAL
ncbi:MAG: hypothetical protein KDJ14_06540 [Xanthomonadales bacterium]|nr:hypothetical protein [Xanthomonadales bacterium]